MMNIRYQCLDAQICLLSWVSFGLEPASDGSGRRTHLLRRDGSRTTTTPSTPTVTSGTEAGRTSGRPGAARSAPVRPAGTRRLGPVCIRSRLSMPALASGGLLRDRWHAAGRVLSLSHHGQRAVAVFRAGSRDPDRRSGRLTVDHRLAAWFLRLSSGRRRVSLDRRRPSTHRQSASWPRGPRGCHPGRGARARRSEVPVRRRRSFHSPPAGRPRGSCST